LGDLGVILVSGTPGTGKTTVAKELAKRISYNFIDMGKLAVSEHLYSDEDAERNTKIVDERKLAKRVEEEIVANNDKIIISSHYAEIVSPKLVDRVIVLRTHPDKLRGRLGERGWSDRKIKENIEAEILGVCSYNAVAKYGEGKVYEIDTTDLSPEESVEIALEITGSNGKSHVVGSIDWLSKLESENRLGSYMR
jgi:adenylate kinase